MILKKSAVLKFLVVKPLLLVTFLLCCSKTPGPLDDPIIAREIKVDSRAVYGYSPRPESGLAKFNIDYSNPEQVAAARAKRIEYLKELARDKALLEGEVNRLRKAGKSMEAIARMKVRQRNQSRINFYRKNNDLKGLAAMGKRNLIKYGRAEGPTADQLFEQKGDWEAVVFGSVKTSRAMNVLLGLEFSPAKDE